MIVRVCIDFDAAMQNLTAVADPVLQIGGPVDNSLVPYCRLLFDAFAITEPASYSHTLGNTIVFGGAWTLRIPKPAAAKP
jgi:hypothetical protein